jgi:hypothetical protein
MRKVRWGPDQEDNALPGTCVLNLLVEFERVASRVSPDVEHHEIIDMGLPEKSGGGELFGFMHFYSATSQDGSAYFARGLAVVDQQNFLAFENLAATKWWRAIHTTLPKRARPLWKGESGKVCAEKGRESTEM